MMETDLLAMLARSTVAASLATVFVMTVRLPLRRSCGCGVAYAAWLAVPLAALASVLPRPPIQVPAIGVSTFTSLMIDSTTAIPAPSATLTWQLIAETVWIIGALVVVVRSMCAQRAYVESLGPLAIAGGVAVSSASDASPALLGLLRPMITVPSDFAQRYTSIEQQLILEHERAHAVARDPLINLLCAGLLSLWWFNPLIHLASRLLRADQELARDADVMRRHPGTRQAYAAAMLKTQLASPIHATLVCRWEPKHPLKERIVSLSRTPSTAARHTGRLVLSVCLLCCAYAAWAEQPFVDGAPTDVRTKPDATKPVRTFSDWENARPSSTVTVSPGPQPGQFLVRARVVDLTTSKVLSEPRILTTAGPTATLETGGNNLLVRFLVTVDRSGKEASYTNEVLRNGKVESSQSMILAVDSHRASQSMTEPAPMAEPRSTSTPGEQTFQLVFASTDRADLDCVAGVFDDVGKAEYGVTMRSSWDETRHEGAFKAIMKTTPSTADTIVRSLGKCQLKPGSKLTWSGRGGQMIPRDASAISKARTVVDCSRLDLPTPLCSDGSQRR